MYRIKIAGRPTFFDPTDPPNPNPNPPSPPAPPPPPAPRTFTQDEVNRMLAEEKRKLQSKNNETIQQLEQLKQNQQLTEEERNNLQQQIEQLQAQFQTKEQQAQTELERLQKKYENDTKKLTTDKESWKNRFETYVMKHEVVSEFASDVFNVGQIEAILLPKMKIVEEIDSTTKQPTGKFVTQVDFEGRDEKGNPIPLKALSLKDTKKAMKEMPDVYGNLFKSDAASGVGQMPVTTTPSGGAIGNLENLSPQEYAQKRALIRQEMATK